MILNDLLDFKFNLKQWTISDVRIDIPRFGKGSDAINLHTQYSNPLVCLRKNGIDAYGAGFTLGLGNDLICRAVEDILQLYDGSTLRELSQDWESPYAFLVNPHQIRWLSPNAGVQYQATGVILNTIVDFFGKKHNEPAWKLFLDISHSDFLGFYGENTNLSSIFEIDNTIFTPTPQVLNENITLIEKNGLPVYHTTWIGFDVDTLSKEILNVFHDEGKTLFKLKVGPDVEYFLNKIDRLKEILPEDIILCADANQTLSLEIAKKFILALEARGILWLEEPFAPDNIVLFDELIKYKEKHNLIIEIVTGENCSSPHVALSLMMAGIDRFQADPCRMLGFIDIILVCEIAYRLNCPITPHAGGSCLDELSAHISFYNQARYFGIKDFDSSLLENVSFCSHFMAQPALVSRGRVEAPRMGGLLVGFASEINSKLINFKDGITWLKL